MNQASPQDLVGQLSPELFWDVDRSRIDLERHREWLLSRILQRGLWQDWQVISRALGSDCLRMLEPQLKLPRRERNFLKVWLAVHDAR